MKYVVDLPPGSPWLGFEPGGRNGSYAGTPATGSRYMTFRAKRPRMRSPRRFVHRASKRPLLIAAWGPLITDLTSREDGLKSGYFLRRLSIISEVTSRVHFRPGPATKGLTMKAVDSALPL